MSIIFNSSPVNAIKYNGSTVKDVMYNGDHVWCVAPSVSIYHVQKDGSTYYIGPVVTNNSTKSVTYTVQNSNYGKKSVTLATGKSSQVVLATSTSVPSTASVTWSISFLGRILTFSTTGDSVLA